MLTPKCSLTFCSTARLILPATEFTALRTPMYGILILLMSHFHNCMVWCYLWQAYCSIHLPVISDRWYSCQLFEKWTVSPCRKYSSVNIGFFFCGGEGGVQQIQLRTGQRETGIWGW
jgi:hypothetical protein